MTNKFDELTKGLAQSVTRRAALKKFGVGLAGMALACFGLASKAGAGQPKPRDGYTCCLYNCRTGILDVPRRVCQAPGSCPALANCFLTKASTGNCTFYCT